MSKRSRSKANIPIHRESLFWILSPVFCLLPAPPILPSLPKNYDVIMQNKPNFPKPKTNATLFAAKDYENDARPAARKNKPNQTQFPRAIRNTRYEIRILSPRDTQYAIRDTRYDIRHTEYEIQTQSNPIPPPPNHQLSIINNQSQSPRSLCALTMHSLTLGTLVHFSHFSLTFPLPWPLTHRGKTCNLSAIIPQKGPR
jgi:hypothetical protein